MIIIKLIPIIFFFVIVPVVMIFDPQPRHWMLGLLAGFVIFIIWAVIWAIIDWKRGRAEQRYYEEQSDPDPKTVKRRRMIEIRAYEDQAQQRADNKRRQQSGLSDIRQAEYDAYNQSDRS